MAQANGFLKDMRDPHRRHQGDAEDHQGHADGRGVEAAPRAGRGRSGAALCRAHGQGARQYRRLGRAGSTRRRRCCAAPAATRCICWSSAPPSAACAAPFNSAIVRLAREHANALIAEGKEVKFFCVGRKGYEQLRRLYDKQIVERVELRAVRTLGFVNAEAIADKIIGAVRGRRVRRLHAVLLALQVGDRADPDRAADHPAGVRSDGRGTAPAARSTNTSPRKRKSSPSSCRAMSPCRFSARCWRTPPRSTARR